MDERIIDFEGRGAWVQYRVLMVLYALVFNRWLYGIFCRFLARFFPYENKVLLDVGGQAYRVYLNDGYWTRFYLYHRDYEPEVSRVLHSAKGATTLFCDLGANAGLWSVYGSHLFKNVVAVEASQGTFDRLQENVAPLDNVSAQRAAVFSRSGDKMSFVNVRNSHASAHLDLSADTGEMDQVETVMTVCLDDFIPKGTPALVKLDVEGAEIAAIDGGLRALNDGAVLIYEDHGSDLKSKVSQHLLDLGNISVYSIEDTAQLVTDAQHLARIKTDRYKGYNFLAGHRGSALLKTIVENFAKDGRAQ